jgi:polyribonucleotide nucleotidyltransferase
MQPEGKQFSALVGGQSIVIETGRLAGQAGGSVTVRLGDSMVFAAATMGSKPREAIDFFPLTVEYEERLYATGKIPGSFFRREGRPGGEAILTSRLIDRPLRPLFNQDMRNEVQVILFTISADPENPLDILAINAASAALMISDVPWGGPVGAVRVGRVNGEFVINPNYSQMDVSELDLRLAGTKDALLMVEAGANELTEDVILEALTLGHQAIQPLIEAQERLAAELGKTKREVPVFSLDETLAETIYNRVSGELKAILDRPFVKADLYSAVDSLEETIVAENAEENPEQAGSIKMAFEEAYKRVVRERILARSLRPDGRALAEIRPIWCDVNVSPRAHGSGLFTRGETQVMTLATLGTPKEAQELDTLSPTESKRYMHHYNFPPYCTGEVKMLRGQSRREVGHGALAERALLPVIPSVKEFPYTLRLVSEVLSSNGSSSMGSVCGSTLALMDTGVPIKAPVAGIAMGLIKEGDNYVILSDIQGLEDHLGDMDFKVAGTEKGITALQMDIKIKGITPQIMAEALSQARVGRTSILDKMLAVLPAPRAELKPHAPRITIIKIPVDKIGAIIGPGGKNIRALQEETHTKIDIDDDGSVFIAATDGRDEAAARERILGLTESPELGRIYTGKVVRVTDFGAFVEIMPNVDGMVHISQLDSERVERVEDVASVGDELTVMVTGIDPAGKIRLSRQAVLEGWTVEEAAERDRKRSGPPSGGRSGGGRSGGSYDRGGNRGQGDRGGRR